MEYLHSYFVLEVDRSVFCDIGSTEKGACNLNLNAFYSNGTGSPRASQE
jgi:hypothetical protein